MADRIFNLTNGVSFGAKYVVQASDLQMAAVAEIIKITVTGGCTVNGNLTVIIRGTSQTIAVTTTHDLASEVATQIATGTWTGFTDAAVGAVVTFTASAAGAKTGANSIDVAATGVTATLEVFTLGADLTPANVEFTFKSSDCTVPVAYPIVANAIVTAANGANVALADAVITYPENGKFKIQDGATTFDLAENQIISVVAQRADITAE